MDFAQLNSHTNDMEHINIAHEFITKSLPVELLNLFKLNSDVQSHLIRNVANKGLHIPQIYTTSFREKSLKYCHSHLEHIY